jgi:phosphoribosylaminoimidazolecarboxamide formyltransferase/IMP cyclohydrolase
MSDKLGRSSYLSKNVGNYPDSIDLLGVPFTKIDDLRYGTNPHQTAAWFKPAGAVSAIGDLEVLKDGKSGLSQTNLEDISYALNICKFFDQPVCACMKHVNPCGVAVAVDDEALRSVYARARDCDPRAAFGSVMGFNVEVDADTADEIMSTFAECVVAPSFTDDAVAVFNDHEKYKRNKHLRVLKCGDLASLPRYVGDDCAQARTIKVFADGSLVIADPLLTNLRCVEDVPRASASSKATGDVTSQTAASPQQLIDLLTAWYVNLSVRSNGVVIVKNGETIAVGTGEQDRVGAVEQAIAKFKEKYEGKETIDGAVMASDGFFPFPDAVEVAAAAGVTATISPAGSMKDAAVILRADELGVAMFHAPERIFSHH